MAATLRSCTREIRAGTSMPRTSSCAIPATARLRVAPLPPAWRAATPQVLIRPQARTTETHSSARMVTMWCLVPQWGSQMAARSSWHSPGIKENDLEPQTETNLHHVLSGALDRWYLGRDCKRPRELPGLGGEMDLSSIYVCRRARCNLF